jgi:hypothetical protein
MFLYEATTRRGTGSTILACPTFISDQEQGLTILGGNVFENLIVYCSFFEYSKGSRSWQITYSAKRCSKNVA